MIKIIHIITGLGGGGAEHMLYKLLKYSDRDMYYHEVISLLDEGMYGKKIEDLGIKVHSLNLTVKNVFASLMIAMRLSKEFDIVDTWLYHADILGYVIAKTLRKKLIWNIRHSNLDREANKPKTLKIAKVNASLSKYVDLITYNSNRALENHIKFGYANKKSVVIPNGFEIERFKFSPNDRLRVRKELGLTQKDKVIITVGRWDIQKDYYTFVKALGELRKKHLKFKFIMVGSNLDSSNDELVNLVNNYNLTNKAILLGRRNDVSALLSAADIYVSSSIGESFSNAIGEAMACELPCVVTNVGDSKIMVGDTGRVVDAKDYIAMSNVLQEYLEANSLVRNVHARNKVIARYEIKEVSRIFEEQYKFVYHYY